MDSFPAGGFQAEMASTTSALAAAGVRGDLGAILTETQVMGIGGGLGGGYFVFEYGGMPSFYIAFRHRWHEFPFYLTTLAERLGVNASIVETGSEAKARLNLAQALESGDSVLVWADRAHLPHRVQSSWQGGYYHHVVRVLEAADAAVVIEDGASQPFQVSPDTFMAARSAIRANKYRLMRFASTHKPVDLRQAKEDGIRSAIEDRSSVPSFQQNFGNAAFHKWAGLLANEKDKKGWPKVFGTGQALYRALAGIFEMVHLETGGGALRIRYAEYLRQASTVLDRPELMEVADLYQALGGQWTEFANAALPDTIPLLTDTRHLLLERDRLYRSNAIPEARSVQQQLDVLENHASTGLDIPDASIVELRRDLADRLTVIATGEDAALAKLQATTQVIA